MKIVPVIAKRKEKRINEMKRILRNIDEEYKEAREEPKMRVIVMSIAPSKFFSEYLIHHDIYRTVWSLTWCRNQSIGFSEKRWHSKNHVFYQRFFLVNLFSRATIRGLILSMLPSGIIIVSRISREEWIQQTRKWLFARTFLQDSYHWWPQDCRSLVKDEWCQTEIPCGWITRGKTGSTIPNQRKRRAIGHVESVVPCDTHSLTYIV